MVNFKSLMSEEQISNTRKAEAEISRLRGLTDVWLANAILKLARDCRQTFPLNLSDPNARIYDNALVWHLIPEIAKRLGATNIQPNEARRLDFIEATDIELAQYTEDYVCNISMGSWETALPVASFPSHQLLSRNKELGNPVVIAADHMLELTSPHEPPEDVDITVPFKAF